MRIEDWIDQYAAEDVIATLGPLVTEERRGKIDAVLEQRLSGLTVVLENLHDPHNGAAALRSIEGFGLSELHVVEAAEPFRFSPAVSQGCEKWIAIWRWKTFGECADALHARGFTLHAALPPSESVESVPLAALDVGRKTALVFGNEHAGLTGAAQAACDGRFAIPMPGFTRSFNLSVSVAISVHDCAARRRVHFGGRGDLAESELTRLRARWLALSMDGRAAEGIMARSASR
jgi:tRNA (guanosine-2'-O-)-methyltransferase